MVSHVEFCRIVILLTTRSLIAHIAGQSTSRGGASTLRGRKVTHGSLLRGNANRSDRVRRIIHARRLGRLRTARPSFPCLRCLLPTSLVFRCMLCARPHPMPGWSGSIWRNPCRRLGLRPASRFGLRTFLRLAISYPRSGGSTHSTHATPLRFAHTPSSRCLST